MPVMKSFGRRVTQVLIYSTLAFLAFLISKLTTSQKQQELHPMAHNILLNGDIHTPGTSDFLLSVFLRQ